MFLTSFIMYGRTIKVRMDNYSIRTLTNCFGVSCK